MNDIKVTVYCITYNQEKYIEQTLSSLVMQKANFKYEVLVHDDASTDRTPEIIRDFEQKYPDIIKPILQTENQYSKGINIASVHLQPLTRGKYVANCEGDDYWTDEYKLQTQYDIMEQNPDVALCVHRVQCVNEDDTTAQKVHPEEKYGVEGSGIINQDRFADLMLSKGGYPFHTSSFFRRKELIEGEVFDKLKDKINGDKRILYSALHMGNIYYIDKVMSHRRLFSIGNYNSRLLQKSQSEKWNIYLNELRAEVIFDKLSKGKFHEKIAESLLNHLYYQFQRKDTKIVKEAFKELDKGINYNWSSFKLNIKYIIMKLYPKLIPLIYKKKK